MFVVPPASSHFQSLKTAHQEQPTLVYDTAFTNLRILVLQRQIFVGNRYCLVYNQNISITGSPLHHKKRVLILETFSVSRTG